jgi:hypothetical protein
MSSPLPYSTYPLPYLLMLSSSSLHNILCCRLFIRLFYVILSSILFTLYNILPLPVVDRRQTSLQYYFTSYLQQTILCHHPFYPLLTIYRTLPLPVVLFSSKYYFMSPSLHNLILCRHLLPYSTYHLPYLFMLSPSSSQYFMLSSSSQDYFMSSPLPSLLTTYSILPLPVVIFFSSQEYFMLSPSPSTDYLCPFSQLSSLPLSHPSSPSSSTLTLFNIFFSPS